MSYNQSKYDVDIMLAKIEDNIILAEKRKRGVYTSFLYEEEQAKVLNLLKGRKINYFFYGGFEESQRKILGVFYENIDIELEEFPITVLEFTYNKEYNLSHRDFLGGLMSIGIKRNVIGDILIENGRAVIFVKSEMISYINTQIEKIGKVRVDIKITDNTNLPSMYDIKEKVYTVTSLRLDNIISGIANTSREKSAKIIKTGIVNVNHITKENVSYNISKSDVITIKGKGKYVVEEIQGMTKKGKIKINIKHYC